jgi:hypothetical protein
MNYINGGQEQRNNQLDDDEYMYVMGYESVHNEVYKKY